MTIHGDQVASNLGGCNINDDNIVRDVHGSQESNGNDTLRPISPAKKIVVGRSKSKKGKSKSPMRQQQRKNNGSKSPPNRNKSKSTVPRNNKSKSPTRRNGSNKSKSPTRKKNMKPAAMTVIIKRCDLWDSAAHFQPEECFQFQSQSCISRVLPYKFLTDDHLTPTENEAVGRQLNTITVARVPHSVLETNCDVAPRIHDECDKDTHHCSVIDTSIPNPHDPNVVHDKYWAQRRRLFARFDRGIQLDAEGWYSVTPQVIADHVAERVQSLVTTSKVFQKCKQSDDGKGVIILDGFCGCGGNAIAFGKIPSHIVSKVICVDTDRSKLEKAAHNASLYDIPKDKLVFVQCNSIFILKHCYRNGTFVLDQPQSSMPKYMPTPVQTTTHAGYRIGGLNLLPREIDLAFFDPPWGGIDYEVLGKNAYDLERNMKILVSFGEEENNEKIEEDSNRVTDDFFDTFAAPQHTMSKKARKKNFNKKTEGEFVNGMELVKLAAEAVSSRVVLLDLPRNSSKNSLGLCALRAGYHGNIKLEEHYLNGRLKTVTAYLGSDYSRLINEAD